MRGFVFVLDVCVDDLWLGVIVRLGRLERDIAGIAGKIDIVERLSLGPQRWRP